MDTEAVLIPLTQGYSAIIDAADYEQLFLCEFHDGLLWTGRICDRKWKASVKTHTVYATCRFAGRELRLHRAIMCARAGQLIDHHDHDGRNCRRYNLRRTTLAGNAQNKLPSRNRAVPFKGVAIHKQTGRFEAYIKQGGKKFHLGLHDTAELAGLAYNAAALERFGDFACLNEVSP